MNKLFAVLKREYLQAVRKKMFVIMTFLLPFLMSGIFVIPSIMMSKGIGQKRVTVLDGTGKLARAFAASDEHEDSKDAGAAARQALSGKRQAEQPQKMTIDYVNRAGDEHLKETAKPYLDKLGSEKDGNKIDAVMIIPPEVATGDEKAEMTFYSHTAADVVTEERLAAMANKGIQYDRLAAKGVNGEVLSSVLRDIPVESVQLLKTGEEKKGGGSNLFIAFIFAGLLILPSFVYGTEIMRGIIQEKMDRIVEILVSSMTPAQLLSGKVLGIAAVGLTQISVWLTMGTVAAYCGLAASLGDANIIQFLRMSTFFSFLVFFILAYLTYVCVYAIAGAICNSDKEAQQLIGPISMVMMLPWFLMLGIITNPDSNMVAGLSMAPIFGPITMFVRTLVTEPPAWQLAVSIAVSIATIVLFFWITAKIFRVGILSYGKRPSMSELWRWLKVA